MTSQDLAKATGISEAELIRIATTTAATIKTRFDAAGVAITEANVEAALLPALQVGIRAYDDMLKNSEETARRVLALL